MSPTMYQFLITFNINCNHEGLIALYWQVFLFVGLHLPLTLIMGNQGRKKVTLCYIKHYILFLECTELGIACHPYQLHYN